MEYFVVGLVIMAFVFSIAAYTKVERIEKALRKEGINLAPEDRP